MDNGQHMHGENGCADCQGHGNRHWRHIIIRILVALFIFWAGVQFGELKAMIRESFSGYQGFGMMSGWNGGNQGYFRASMPMMLYTNTYGGNGQATTQAAPATSK